MTDGTNRRVSHRCGRLGAAAAATMALFSLSPAAHAAQAAWAAAEVDENGDLLDSGAPPEGKTTWGESLKFTSAGKLTVSAYDLGVAGTLMGPLAVDGLSFSVSNSTSLLGWHVGDGMMAFQINGPGEFFVNFSATPDPNARFPVPLVSWRVSFEPNVSAVPLPASVWLLAAGLAWATGMQRKRAKLTSRESGEAFCWKPVAAY